MSITSGALGLLGFSGAGFVIGIAALAIAFQISRVEDSNKLETKHTEAFLQELGFSEDVAHHLKNADSEGRSIGLVLQKVMEYSGSNKDAFSRAMLSLSPSEALKLAEACHGVIQ